jgi:hypothetical protein
MGSRDVQVLPFVFLFYYILVQTFDGNLSNVSRAVKHFEKRMSNVGMLDRTP